MDSIWIHYLISVRTSLIYLIFLSFTASCALTGDSTAYWEAPFAQPYFDNTTKREHTATVGQSALLHCRVRNLGDRAVSIKIDVCVGVNTRLPACQTKQYLKRISLDV